MKQSIYRVCTAILVLTGTVSCNSFKDAASINDIERISITVTATSKIAVVTDLTGLTLKIDNVSEEISITETFTGTSMTVDGLLPGNYSISLGGRVEGTDGESYYMGANLPRQTLIPGRTNAHIEIEGVGIKPMVFKEIYYACVPNETGSGNYLVDQYHEIYNNSEKTIYLDNIYICNIEPNGATATPPKWPAEDGENYLYGWRVWRFPGKGSDYPLAPGESCIIASQAWNHTQWNSKGQNLISAEFEFYMNHANGDNAKVPNMEHTYYYGSKGSAMGTIKQYMVPVGGPAMVLFQVPVDSDFNPDAAKWQSTKVGATTTYLKIPREWILDAVECGQDETKLKQKRVPGVLDYGMTWTGAQANGVSVYRKKVGENPDGTPILQDTNNSTNDFLRSSDEDENDPDNRKPMLRRYGPKVPSWSASHNM
ncbi:DUF4876 domain-containing protein [Alistipes sp. OttesenSCG-928-B03]|nr:DUF4876 domain-containing protein [Alistipes sp. OttesenSCG-928-B03]